MGHCRVDEEDRPVDHVQEHVANEPRGTRITMDPRDEGIRVRQTAQIPGNRSPAV